MLGPYRVLDLTDDGAMFCGQILADLVVLILRDQPAAGQRGQKAVFNRHSATA